MGWGSSWSWACWLKMSSSWPTESWMILSEITIFNQIQALPILFTHDGGHMQVTSHVHYLSSIQCWPKQHVAGQDEGRKLSSIDGINYCYILKKFPQLITWLANTATSTQHVPLPNLHELAQDWTSTYLTIGHFHGTSRTYQALWHTGPLFSSGEEHQHWLEVPRWCSQWHGPSTCSTSSLHPQRQPSVHWSWQLCWSAGSEFIQACVLQTSEYQCHQPPPSLSML